MQLHWKAKLAGNDKGSRLYAGQLCQVLATTFPHDNGWRAIIRMGTDPDIRPNLSPVCGSEDDAKEWAKCYVRDWFALASAE